MEETIFINYRRGDDQAAAGRLYDQLEGAFTRARIFLDVDSIPPGRDYTEELAQRVNQCDILLAIIGRRWADAVDGDGGRRLDNPNDWVRVEIEFALRLGKHIIPVLVDGAEMPPPAKLPESLRPLTRRNATRLTHERFRADAQGLVAAIGKLRQEARARLEADLKEHRWPTSTTVEVERSEWEWPRQEEARSRASGGQVHGGASLGATPTPFVARKSMRFGYVALAALALVAGAFGLMFFNERYLISSAGQSGLAVVKQMVGTLINTNTTSVPAQQESSGSTLDKQKLDALINKNMPSPAPFVPAQQQSSGSALDKQKLDALINKNAPAPAPFAPAPKQ